ncbi:transporter substrate-binding domain-containing protein [Mesorhizobium sp. M8A.F.Ca.ET.165.01.1.1]|jgi:lysine-arginine-ornithine-binding protein|uniref:transporter substrate-binding domain-containing protein n=1 Tax=Mesorhizobium sp. M8A.F.Ca.ET.165.01.1.1 TaxID=2563960 RepID=UPI00109382CD|nr:transporter substrate-binding domain-containing protein [Mesorhizobium sp. M8A.F.Ca.ET.165.01.1.1]TGT46316.1 transporter substrate-binding domain-containing protein [Mesorhizobium sp. M8A.F.Ca.ET.165.01.1.1]
MIPRFAGALLTAAAILLMVGEAEADQTIHFATEGAFPPFNERAPDGSLAGFEIDLGMAMCARMGRHCEFIAQEWDGMIPGLLAHKYDGIFASMAITEERKKKIDFSNKYYESGGVFVAPVGVTIDVADKQLKAKTVGTLSGSTYLCYLEKTYPTAKVVTYPNADALYLDLTSGRLDAIFADAVASDFGLLKTDAGKNMAFASKIVTDRGCFGEGAGIGLRKEDAQLREELNKAITEVRQDGTYDKIAKKYFGYDIYGN